MHKRGNVIAAPSVNAISPCVVIANSFQEINCEIESLALHPEQKQMQEWLTKALDEVRQGVAAARRMLLERCELREDKDGQVRPIREPLPAGALAAAKSAPA